MYIQPECLPSVFAHLPLKEKNPTPTMVRKVLVLRQSLGPTLSKVEGLATNTSVSTERQVWGRWLVKRKNFYNYS